MIRNIVRISKIKSREMGILCTLVALILTSCAQEPRETIQIVPDPAHNSRLSLDWWGVYTGVLPCADCEGIDTRLIIFEDGTYRKSSRYLGKQDELTTLDEGSFEWTEDGSTIELEIEDEPSSYRVGENKLTRLDANGQIITGELASFYVFQKQFPDGRIEGVQWSPVELMGNNITENVVFNTPPRITLNFIEQRINGNGGCNTFFSSYHRDGYELKFGNIASTMMACTPELMDIEQQFFEVLNSTTSWESRDNNLYLKNAENVIISRLTMIVTE
jgi:heat shock protein HslJ